MGTSYRNLPQNIKDKLGIKDAPKKPTAWKAAWHVIDGRRNYYRSHWEYHYALYLQMLKEKGKITEWEHEPHTFWFEGIKRGVCSYKPDFRVTHLNDSQEYCEVKGYYDSKSLTKIKRMAKYHPKVKFRVVDNVWFTQNNSALKVLIPDYK